MSDLEGLIELGTIAAVEVAASELAARGEEARACPNCGAKLIGPYCAVCGQERDTHRRSVYALVHDLVIDIISFDSRVLRTAKALVLQPGELATAFREGRTRRYVPAIRLYLFVSLIFFLVLSLSGLALMQLQVTATPVKVTRDAQGNPFIANPAYDPDDSTLKKLPKLIPVDRKKADRPGGLYSFGTHVHFFAPIGKFQAELTPAEKERLRNINVTVGFADTDEERKQMEKTTNWLQTHIYGGIQKLAADPAALNGPLTTWIPRALFLLLPLYALLLAIFYWRQRKTFFFVDHLVFSLGVHTFTFVALIAAAGLAQILSGGTVALLFLAAMTIYIFIAMKRFYRQGWFWTTMKFGTVSFIYTIFFLIPALATAIAMSFFDT